jgi:NO-binding membrane sensor protein with MHYT domain
MGVLFQATNFGLSILLPHFIIRLDERHLTPIQYQRGWTLVSHWSAIVAFSWLCLPIHFIKTRRNPFGIALGALVTSVGLGVHSGVLYALSWFGA